MVIGKLNRLFRCHRGQALVELALVLPILLLLLMGIIEFGRIFFSYLTITELAREGARYGVVGHSDAQIISHIENHSTVLDALDMGIDISPPDLVRQRGDGLTITVNYSVDLIVPFPEGVVPDPVPLMASCTMRME
ncbi:MAG: pilus assembly protein [Syntrophomonadaceae bacterium]|nr:pilus assembly protein [Syntrophomonadaceae bacterium]